MRALRTVSIASVIVLIFIGWGELASQAPDREVKEVGHSLSGRILYYANPSPVDEVEVRLFGVLVDSTTLEMLTTTNQEGRYCFSDLPLGRSYSVEPQRRAGGPEDEEAITEYDAAVVLMAVVGLGDSLSRGQEIAADVTGFAGITAYDAALILRRNVGLITEFPLPDWSFPLLLAVIYPAPNFGPTTDEELSDLPAVLRGDVSGNWRTPVPGTPGSNKVLTLGVRQLWVETNKTERGWLSSVFIDDPTEIVSGGFELSFPGQLRLLKVERGNLTQDYLLESHISGGKLRVAMAGAEALTGEAQELFQIQFEANGSLDKDQVSLDGVRLNEGMIPVEVIQVSPTGVGSQEETVLPSEFRLGQNFPNPFNPETTIRYALPEAAHATLGIYNILGQKVATLVDQEKPAGYHEVIWNGRDSSDQLLASGVYFYQLIAGEFQRTRRMMLMK